jgi:hypothetical protein
MRSFWSTMAKILEGQGWEFDGLHVDVAGAANDRGREAIL